MAAYLVALDPEDGYGNPEGMAQYAETVKGIIESFGGRYLARHKETRLLDGDWQPDYIVLVEFPSMSRLLEFYESEEYRPWLELRRKAGDGRIIAAEG